MCKMILLCHFCLIGYKDEQTNSRYSFIIIKHMKNIHGLTYNKYKMKFKFTIWQVIKKLKGTYYTSF